MQKDQKSSMVRTFKRWQQKMFFYSPLRPCAVLKKLHLKVDSCEGQYSNCHRTVQQAVETMENIRLLVPQLSAEWFVQMVDSKTRDKSGSKTCRQKENGQEGHKGKVAYLLLKDGDCETEVPGDLLQLQNMVDENVDMISDGGCPCCADMMASRLTRRGLTIGQKSVMDQSAFLISRVKRCYFEDD
ncbi:hypothetical protein Tco_0031851 [Tanacetum coccineum]